jgi:hypothetical protein
MQAWRAPAISNTMRAGCGPFLYCPPGHRRAYSDAGAERARRSASPPRTARAQGSRLGYGTGTAERKVHERLYFNADEIRARKAEQRQLRCGAGTARTASGGTACLWQVRRTRESSLGRLHAYVHCERSRGCGGCHGSRECHA